jgi:hypothetical protein
MNITTARKVTGAQNTITEESIGEHRLWTAVIVKAVEDWRFGTTRTRHEAQKFLFESARDFEMVCGRAGLDASCLSEKLLKLGRRLEPRMHFIHPLAA